MEIGAEVRLILKSQAVGHLLDGEALVAQENLGPLDGFLNDEGLGRLSRKGLANHGEVFRRDVQAFSITAHVAQGLGGVLQYGGESLEDVFGRGKGACGLFLFGLLEHFTHGIDKGREDVVQALARKGCAGFLEQIAQEVVVEADDFLLLLVDLHEVVLLGRKDEVPFQAGIVEQFLGLGARDGETTHLNVHTDHGVLEQDLWQADKQVAGRQLKFLALHLNRGVPLEHEHHDIFLHQDGLRDVLQHLRDVAHQTNGIVAVIYIVEGHSGGGLEGGHRLRVGAIRFGGKGNDLQENRVAISGKNAHFILISA